ncbi:MAG: hypothetical protein ACXVW9_15195 [Nocardioidaceae bacterium]
MTAQRKKLFGRGRQPRHRAAGGSVDTPAGWTGRAHASHPRRFVWSVVVAAAVATLLAGVGWQVLVRGRSTPKTLESSGTSTAAGSPRRSPTPTPTATGAPGAGSGTTTVSLAGGGLLHATEVLDFRTAQSNVVLSVSPGVGVARQFHQQVRGLSVQWAGHALQSRGTMLPGQSTTIELTGGATRVTVGYDVHGAVVRSQPSSAGRALALLTPLEVDQVPGVRTQVRLTSPEVLNVGCVAPGGALHTCGAQVGQTWVVDGTAPQPVAEVVAQVDTTKPPR